MRILFLLILLCPSLSLAADRLDPKSIEPSEDMEKMVAQGEHYAAAVLSADFKRFSTDKRQSIVVAEIERTRD